MAQTVTQIINEAFTKAGVVADGKAPSPTQAATGLTILNDNLLTQMVDGWGDIGWYPQTNPSNIAPLRDEDIGDVKLCLVAWLCIHYGIPIPASTNPYDPDDQVSLAAQIKAAFKRLSKRYLRFTEADFGELSRAQGGPWGGPNYL
jgi:hypothetical protein